MSFLRAEWRRLALINYVVDPELLQPLVPAGTTLDLWQGRCYVSLVGFMFINTRMLGLKIPLHVNFEEVNLRFYVTYQDSSEVKRGVVFIREIVPRRALTFVANTLYREHYQTLPMSHSWTQDKDQMITRYAWKTRSRWNHIHLISEAKTSAIAPGSEAEFITEHYWGYTRVDARTTFEYQVTHPRWRQHAVVDYDIDVDFRETYGDTFNFLGSLAPTSVMLAEGSPITVEQKKKITR